MTHTEPLTYLGATRDRHGSSYGTLETEKSEGWYLTTNADQLYSLEDENVIWATSIEELAAKLEERYPPEQGYSRVQIGHRGATAYRYPVISDAGIDRGDPNRDKLYALKIIEAARKVGTVCLGSAYNAPHGVYDECVLVDSNPITLAHNPKKAAKIKERDERRLMNRPVGADDLSRMWYNLKHYVGSYTYHEDIKGGQSRYDYITGIRICLWQFERIYGKGIFRRLAEWQAFVKEWKTLLDPTEKLFKKEIEKYRADTENKEWGEKCATRLEEFMAFMRKETRKRKPKIEDGKTIRERAVKIDFPK